MAVLNFPDPAAQTPANTFSPTSTPDATSNGVTYVWTDGSWSIASVSNGGFLDKDEADSYYVEQSGDNMTGDLTLGTDKITLDATDGSAEFAGGAGVIGGSEIRVGGGSAGFATQDNGGTGVYAGSALNLRDTAGDLKVDIKSNGTAEFTGTLTSALGIFDRKVGGVATTLVVEDSGTRTVQFAANGNTGIGGTLTGNASTDTPNIQLKADGSAYFAGDVRIGAVNYFKWFDNPGSMWLRVNTSKADQAVLYCNTDAIGANQSVFKIRANGDADFAGTVRSNVTVGRSIIIETEADNSANYVAATSTEIDPDTGEEVTVQTQVYNGPTLDVKEVIQELQQRVADRDAVIADFSTRLAQLEADHATLMGNSNGGY